jgi:hypothetical protein
VAAVKKTQLVKGRDLDGNEKVLEKTHPYQLELFQHLLPDEDRYSNTLELYDATPRFFPSPKKMASMRENGKYLGTLRRPFCFRNKNYTLEIRPGRITTKHEEDIEYYPSEREQFVEEALWKIAHDRAKGCYLDRMVSVEFTLYELRNELAKRGHSIHFDALFDSLSILNRCNITLRNESGRSIFSSAIFPVLLVSSREDWLKNPKGTKCYVQFNVLATKSLSSINYRLFDYVKFMEIDMMLARWLFKRLSHNFIQAKLVGEPYTIKASTIVRDSGLVNCESFRFNVRSIDETLEELKNKRIIHRYSKSKVNDPHDKRKTSDVIYQLFPTREFVDEIVNANRRSLFLEEKAEKDGKITAAIVEGKRLIEVVE